MPTPAEPTVVLPVPRDRQRLLNVPARISEHVVVLVSPGGHGMWCTTSGLRPFGLPELQTLRVPFRVVEEWAAAMSGVALVLLERWLRAIHDPDAAFVELPAIVPISAALVGRPYGVDDPNDRPVGAVQLHLEPSADMAADAFLTIEAPDGVRVSHASFLTRLCRDLRAAHTHPWIPHMHDV